MPVKIKIISAKAAHVPVTVHRPAWREFLSY